MAPWLRVLAALAEVQFPATTWQLTTCNSHPKRYNDLFRPPEALHAYGPQTYGDKTLTHIKLK